MIFHSVYGICGAPNNSTTSLSKIEVIFHSVYGICGAPTNSITSLGKIETECNYLTYITEFTAQCIRNLRYSYYLLPIEMECNYPEFAALLIK